MICAVFKMNCIRRKWAEPHSCDMQVMEALVEKYGDVFTFVICTGLSHAEAASLSSKSGAAGFLCKPYQADAVLTMIRNVASSTQGQPETTATSP